MANPLRDLPSVTEVLAAADRLVSEHGHTPVVEAVRTELDELRRRLSAGEALDGVLKPEAVVQAAAARLARDSQPQLRTVINATGIVLHTNLGRAPLAESPPKPRPTPRRGYLNLELDLETGKRSSRHAIDPRAGCAA